MKNQDIEDFKEVLCDIIDCMSTNELYDYEYTDATNKKIVLKLLSKNSLRVTSVGVLTKTRHFNIEDEIFYATDVTDDGCLNPIQQTYKIDNDEKFGPTSAIYFYVYLSGISNELNRMFPGYW